LGWIIFPPNFQFEFFNLFGEITLFFYISRKRFNFKLRNAANKSMEPSDKKIFSDFIQEAIPNISITESEMDEIANQFEVLELDKNEYFLKQGKISKYFILQEGFLRSFTLDKSGNEITTSFYQSNRVLFEPASFFQNQPSTENIQAITNCRGFVSTFEKMNILFHSSRVFREFARAIIIKEFVAFKQQTLSMFNQSAEDRYTQLSHSKKELLQVAQLKHIASFLGITDTSLSRIRNQISKK